MKFNVLILTLSICLNATAGSWTMKSEYKKIKSPDTTVSEITFTSGSNSYVYFPQNMPYGLIEETKVVLSDKEYFLTVWSQGASSIMVRVFSPESHKANPVCELISFSDTPSLRVHKNRLELSVMSDRESKIEWKACGE